jgi:hypothetical protein
MSNPAFVDRMNREHFDGNLPSRCDGGCAILLDRNAWQHDEAVGRAFASGDCERRESVRRQNAAAASQAQSVEHRKVHLRSRGCG